MGRGSIFALFGVTVFFWGTTYRGTAIGVEHAPAIVFGAVRTVPGALVLPLLVRRWPSRTGALYAALSGLLTITLFVYTFSEATARAGAANAAVLINSAPLWVLLLERGLLGQRAELLRVLGLVIGFAGVVVMFSSQIGVHSGVLGGMLYALAGAWAWAGGTLAVKWLANRDERLDPTATTALQYLLGAPVLIAIAFGTRGAGGTDWGSAELWGAELYVAFGAIAGTICFFAVLKRLTATRTSAIQFLVPVVAVLVELARGNVPEAVTFAGMVLAILGVALVNVRLQFRRRAVTEGVGTAP